MVPRQSPNLIKMLPPPAIWPPFALDALILLGQGDLRPHLQRQLWLPEIQPAKQAPRCPAGQVVATDMGPLMRTIRPRVIGSERRIPMIVRRSFDFNGHALFKFHPVGAEVC